MAKSSQTSETKHDKKSKQKQERSTQSEAQLETTPLVPSFPEQVIFDPDLKRHADLLSNPNISTAQRQQLAIKIGNVQGNLHLQRAIAQIKHTKSSSPVQREELNADDTDPVVMRQPQSGTAVDTPTDEDYHLYVQSAIRFFEGAQGFFAVTPVKGRPTGRTEQAGTETVTPESTLREISRILGQWQLTFDNAKQIITNNLNSDAQLSDQLRKSYRQAIESLHHSARDKTPRVNINLIAAPGTGDDEFLANAAAYARTYYGNPPTGDVVITFENIRSLEELFGTIERTHPERMIGRVDIFAHGTIKPSNQLKLAGHWHTAQEIEQAAASRQFSSQYIQSIARFDARSHIEIHGCKLGGGEGRDFLTSTGRTLGGEHNQHITGYQQRWFPRRYQMIWRYTRGHKRLEDAVQNTQQDIYGTNALPVRNGIPADQQAFIQRFERQAVHLYDTVVANSLEVQSYLNNQEQRTGQVTDARKIEIMRVMYDANQAWLLGFLHPAHNVPDMDPSQAIGRQDYTFTREREAWEDRVLRVQIQH